MLQLVTLRPAVTWLMSSSGKLHHRYIKVTDKSVSCTVCLLKLSVIVRAALTGLGQLRQLVIDADITALSQD